MIRVGVNDGLGVAHDRDMALPEHQIAALQVRRIPPAPTIRPRPSCCMSLSRGQPVPAAFRRYLDEAGAIDAQGCSCRPTDRACRRSARPRRRNPFCMLIDAAEMLPRQIPALARHGETDRRRGSPSRMAPIASVSAGGSLIEGPGKANPDSRDLVRRLAGRLRQRAIGQPADIAVAAQLAPRTTFAIAVIDRDALALQRLRQQRRIGGRRLAQRRERIDISNASPSTKRAASTLPSRYFAARSPRAGVRRGSSIAFAQQFVDRARGLAFAAFGPPGLGLSASSRRYRHAASFSRPRRSAAGTARR